MCGHSVFREILTSLFGKFDGFSSRVRSRDLPGELQLFESPKGGDSNSDSSSEVKVLERLP